MRASKRKSKTQVPDWSPEGLGLDVERYQAVLRYLFDRPVPVGQEQEWYWDDGHRAFDATPLEWTKFQTAIFANAAGDLRDFSDEQIGMGLRYLADNGQSDVPFAAIDTSVPLDEAMRMMQAMPKLWQDCFGPRLSSLHAPIGSGAGGRLGNICYMWFDIWYTFYRVRDLEPWRDAVWRVLREILAMPEREVQISALHGIGHLGRYLSRQPAIDDEVKSFLKERVTDDQELRGYAEAARLGRVQ